jgi:uncharacterized protein (TIGR02996 family)
MSNRTCDVCGSKNVTHYRDHINGTLCESFEECKDCPLYMYEYHYGHTRELIGFVEMHSSYDESPGDYRLRQWAKVEARVEARRMWNDPECRPFLNAIRSTPGDNAPSLIFADYLRERGICEMQEQAIRDNCLTVIDQPA